MKTSEVLYKAADLIEEGWMQVVGIVEDGGICAGNALWKVSGKVIDVAVPAQNALLAYLGKPADLLSGIWEWNDTPGRKKTEVIEALRATALIESAKEHAAEFVITTSEDHVRIVAKQFNIPVREVGDRLYVTRWDEKHQTAFVYSCRARVSA